MLDDVDENMSNKFNKHDLIGVPYQIIIGSKSDGGNFEFKELNSNSEILSLEKIKLKLKNNPLFTKAERLISLRNLRPKKERRFLKNHINIFFSRNNVRGFDINNCYVSYEWFQNGINKKNFRT